MVDPEAIFGILEYLNLLTWRAIVYIGFLQISKKLKCGP